MGPGLPNSTFYTSNLCLTMSKFSKMKKKERSAGYSLGCLKPSKLGTLLSARATIKRKCFPVVTASQSYSKLADKSTACPLVIKPTKNGGIKVRE